MCSGLALSNPSYIIESGVAYVSTFLWLIKCQILPVRMKTDAETKRQSQLVERVIHSLENKSGDVDNFDDVM